MKSVAAFFVSMVLLIGWPAQAQDNPIVQQMNAFVAAFNAGDGAGVAAFYTEDGALLVPQAGIVVGRQAIAQHYQTAFDQGVGSLEYNILEIRQVGPAAAVEIGETRVRVGEQTVANRSMHVWTLDGDVWRLSRDMYHVLGVVGDQ